MLINVEYYKILLTKNTFEESVDAYQQINPKIFMAPNKIQPAT